MPNQMRLYHASNFDIDWPDTAQHRLYSDASINGNRALGLFSNTMSQGLAVFGARLYQFTLKSTAKVLEIPDEMYQTGRCAAYYYGIRDLAEHLGYDAVKVTHSPDAISVVVINFGAIKTWSHAGESQ